MLRGRLASDQVRSERPEKIVTCPTTRSKRCDTCVTRIHPEMICRSRDTPLLGMSPTRPRPRVTIATSSQSTSMTIAPEALLRDMVPWRMSRWHYGQRHCSGSYGSSTMSAHVIYESRLELARLLMADFDHSVNHIVAQPFMLCAPLCGTIRRHSRLSVADGRRPGGHGCETSQLARRSGGGRDVRMGARRCGIYGLVVRSRE